MSQQFPDRSTLSDIETRLVDSIGLDEPWALLEAFSGLTRVTGSEDEEEAAEYITDRLAEYGVSFDRYDPELYISQPEGAELTPHGRSFDHGPLKTVAFSAARTVTGRVEFVGSAESDLLNPSGGAEEPYTDVGDLTGKIALTSAGSISIKGMAALEAKNAAGIVSIHEHDREPHCGIATPVWGGAPPLDEKEKIPDVPIVNVCKPDGEQLKAWAESDDGLELTLSTELTTDWMTAPVIVAEIEGAADPENDDFVLLHGHYDSWFVGITDNATGDATMLELARVFDEHRDQLSRNLKIAWWPGHSTGRYAGSTWFADEFAHELDDHCIAQVNCDSPGAKDSAEYSDMSCWTPEAHELVGNAIEDVTGAAYAEEHPHRAGDYSFDNLGISGFFMLSSNIPAAIRAERGYHSVGGCGGNSDAWHLSTDTLDTAGEDELLRDMRLYAVSLSRVLTADVIPLDHQRNARRIAAAVEEYDDVAGEQFDFSPTLRELAALETELGAFYEAATSGAIDREVTNDTIKRLSRSLTRLNLVKRGQFEQDPAVSREPVPRFSVARKFESLDGDDVKFLGVQLKREQNRVVAELRDVRAHLSAVGSTR